MNQYIILGILSLLSVLGAYNQDYLPQPIEDYLTTNVPYIEKLKQSSTIELLPEEKIISATEPSVTIEPISTTEDETLSSLQQQAISEHNNTNSDIKITYGKIQVIRNCESDLDCLKSFPDAGLNIQCDKSNGECYKYTNW